MKSKRNVGVSYDLAGTGDESPKGTGPYEQESEPEQAFNTPD